VKVTRLKEKLTKLKEQMGKLAVCEKQMLASPDQQISLTDPDSHSMATSGRGSGVVGYNVQVAVDTEHHLIVTHEVTNCGSDRAQLANIAKQAKAALKAEKLEAVADRGYFSSPKILECHEAGITVTLPKPLTSGAKSEGRFGKQDFVYLPEQDAYRCPAGERLPYRYTNEEAGKMLRRYWTTACQDCLLKRQCTTGPERRITRWEHEHLLEAVQQRLDANPHAMRQRRETVEHPFGSPLAAHPSVARFVSWVQVPHASPFGRSKRSLRALGDHVGYEQSQQNTVSPDHRLDSACHVRFAGGRHITPCRESGGYLPWAHPLALHSSRQSHHLWPGLSVGFSPSALACGYLLAIARSLELGYERGLLKLGDSAEHPPHKHRSRCVLDEEIGVLCWNERNAQRFQEIVAFQLHSQVAREAIRGFPPECTGRRCRRSYRASP
jgi:hypothetical protein